MKTWLCVVCLVLSGIDLILGKGHVSLDTYNFDKILQKFHATLVKFDVAFPYGDKHEAFLQLAEFSAPRLDFLVAEVGVKDYGEHDNEDLAKRFNIDASQYPTYLLFVQGVKDPYRYHGNTDEDYSVQNVLNFVRSKDPGIWIGAPGCLQDFDKIAKEFVHSQCPHQRKGLLKSAEDLWDNVQTKSARRSAEVYVKTMRKLLEVTKSTDTQKPKDHGKSKEKSSSTNSAQSEDKPKDSEKSKEPPSKSAHSMGEYLSREKTRVKGLLTEKMADAKKEELKQRLNILDSFALYLNPADGGSKGKDEL